MSKYISDFPVPELQGREDVIQIPHLGASTEEAEENCAIMIADQLTDFLENGNIKNSVNFPKPWDGLCPSLPLSSKVSWFLRQLPAWRSSKPVLLDLLKSANVNFLRNPHFSIPTLARTPIW